MLYRKSYLYILHRARLGHTQHVEQLQDQLLDVLQGILLRHKGWMDLLLYLNVTDKQRYEGPITAVWFMEHPAT